MNRRDRVGSRKLALMLARMAEEKKGEGIVVLDMREISSLVDYFVICSGGSDRHVRTLAEEILKERKAGNQPPLHREGIKEGRWVVLDFIDVMVHLFQRDVREHYDLEGLWGDAGRIPWREVESGVDGQGRD